jgi:hypothetical protein
MWFLTIREICSHEVGCLKRMVKKPPNNYKSQLNGKVVVTRK